MSISDRIKRERERRAFLLSLGVGSKVKTFENGVLKSATIIKLTSTNMIGVKLDDGRKVFVSKALIF